MVEVFKSCSHHPVHLEILAILIQTTYSLTSAYSTKSIPLPIRPAGAQS